MRRREFVGLVGGVAAWPLAARAQVAGKVWRIGVLGGGTRLAQIYSGFLRGMRELGYIEGKDFVSELRAADNSYERLPSLADELVRIGADILLTANPPAVLALQKATRTIPIVMAGISDPVGSGCIVSLARPGGNTQAWRPTLPKRRRSNWNCWRPCYPIHPGSECSGIRRRQPLCRSSGLSAKPPGRRGCSWSRLKLVMRRRSRKPSPHSAANRCRRSWWLAMRCFSGCARC